MSEAVVTPRPDVTEMISVHKVFKEAFALAPQLIGSVAPDDTDRAMVVGSYYANILEFLRVHHEGEDILLYPLLLERAPEQADLIKKINDQHHAVEAGLHMAQARTAAWVASPNPDKGAEMAGSIARLNAELAPHLEQEEIDILPIADKHISAEEWGQLPGHALGNFKGDKVWLAIGLIYEAMTDAQKANMLAHMPPPVLEFWQNVGKGQFETFIAEVRA